MLVFEPEVAPPLPIPQERTCMTNLLPSLILPLIMHSDVDRFSSDQITALTQRFALLAPWGLVAVKDCAELLFSLSSTSVYSPYSEICY